MGDTCIVLIEVEFYCVESDDMESGNTTGGFRLALVENIFPQALLEPFAACHLF